MCLGSSTLNNGGEWLDPYTLKKEERVCLGSSTLNNGGEWLGPYTLKEERVCQC